MEDFGCCFRAKLKKVSLSTYVQLYNRGNMELEKNFNWPKNDNACRSYYTHLSYGSLWENLVLLAKYYIWPLKAARLNVLLKVLKTKKIEYLLAERYLQKSLQFLPAVSWMRIFFALEWTFFRNIRRKRIPPIDCLNLLPVKYVKSCSEARETLE